MRGVRVALAGGFCLGLALVTGAWAQSDPEPAIVVDDSTGEPADQATLATTRTLDASEVVVSPFADVSVSAGDASAPSEDEALSRAVPTSTEKLPPGPPNVWP
jgi:hypothetical protein